jgi:regulator of RNase E activity RraA
MSFVINDMPPQINASLLEKCRHVETATIGHRRYMGFVDRRVQSVRAGARMAGTAVTLALPGMDSTLLHHAVQFLRPGDVLVVDRLGDDKHACIGGGVAVAIKATGCAGVVVDGPCTDFPEIEQYDLPLWCRGASPITTRLYGVGGSFNVPICCGGAVVMPGDVVVADFSGVVIMPPQEALGDVDWALDKAAAEPEAHRAMRAGEKLGERSGASRIVAENLSS